MQNFKDGFRKLLAWQIAHMLTKDIYDLTGSFPQDEKYALTSQLRRAASSVAAQIVEGSRMPTYAHRKLYYDRAYASAAEVDYFLQLAFELNYFDKNTYEKLAKQVYYTSALVHRLSASCTHHKN